MSTTRTSGEICTRALFMTFRSRRHDENSTALQTEVHGEMDACQGKPLLTSRRLHWPQNIRRTPLAADKINLPENIHQPTDHRVLLTGKKTLLATRRTDLAGKMLPLTALGTDLATSMTNLAGLGTLLAVQRTDLATQSPRLARQGTNKTRNKRLLVLKGLPCREVVPACLLPRPSPIRTISTSSLINPHLLPGCD